MASCDLVASELQERHLSYELTARLGVTQKTAWFMLQRIRLAMQDETGGKLAGKSKSTKPSSAAKHATCIGNGAKDAGAGKEARPSLPRSGASTARFALTVIR